MNLYLLTQSQETGYDTYDSCVVAAKTEEDAKTIHPSEFQPTYPWTDAMYRSWADSAKYVTATLIGKAVKGTERGVILASFNAG